jgi:predicted nucleic acid-binding protein
MNFFLADASALIKRYAPEAGSALVGHLLSQAPRDRLMCLMLGAAEVVAALVRKRNGGQITPAVFAVALLQFRGEVLDAVDFLKLPVDNLLIGASLPLLDKHSLNATDAILLQLAREQGQVLRAAGNDLVLIASDKRLLKAAQAEGLVTFDPETQTQADLDALLGP